MNAIKAGSCHRFYTGSVICTYRAVLKGDAVYLEGEERLNSRVIYYNTLTFPAIMIFQVRYFAAILAENHTLPRMMRELAEEYFP